MARRSDGGVSATANGFRPKRREPAHAASLAAAAAGLGTPLVGATYGVVRVGYEEYFRALGLSPEVVGLGQAAIVSRVAVIVGLALLLVATYGAVGVTIYRLAGPLTARSAGAGRWYLQLVWLLAPFGVLIAALASSIVVLVWLGMGADARVWAVGALSVGVIALQLSWLAGLEPELGGWVARVVRFIYVNGLPKVGWLLVAVLGGVYVAVSVQNFWRDSASAGRTVRRTGQLSLDNLNVTVAAARVIPKGADPLGICDGARRAVLVGRNGGTSFVLLLPPQDTAGSSEVVPMHDSQYAVAATSGDPQSCDRRAPGAVQLR